MNCVQNNIDIINKVLSSYQNCDNIKCWMKLTLFERLVCVKENAPHYSNTKH